MKSVFILLFLSCCLGWAHGQTGMRYAFVNLEYILNSIPDYMKAQEELNAYSQSLQADIDKVYAEIQRCKGSIMLIKFF